MKTVFHSKNAISMYTSTSIWQGFPLIQWYLHLPEHIWLTCSYAKAKSGPFVCLWICAVLLEFFWDENYYVLHPRHWWFGSGNPLQKTVGPVEKHALFTFAAHCKTMWIEECEAIATIGETLNCKIDSTTNDYQKGLISSRQGSEKTWE